MDSGEPWWSGQRKIVRMYVWPGTDHVTSWSPKTTHAKVLDIRGPPPSLVVVTTVADSSGRTVEGVGFASAHVLGDCEFESRRGHDCLSLVVVVCCQVELSSTGWSLVQRSPTECDASECDRGTSTIRGPWRTRGCGTMTKSNNIYDDNVFWDVTPFSLVWKQPTVSIFRIDFIILPWTWRQTFFRNISIFTSLQIATYQKTASPY